MKHIFLVLLISTSAFAADVTHLDGTPNLSRWGLDVGFGQQPYMESATRFSILSPYVFGAGSNGPNWRVTADFAFKELQSSTEEGFIEYSVSLEQNGRVYRDIIYSFVKFGVGTMALDSDIYDGAVLIFPLSLGLHVITQYTDMGVMSFFIDYRFIAYSNYKQSKGLLADDTFFQGMTSVGLRLLF